MWTAVNQTSLCISICKVRSELSLGDIQAQKDFSRTALSLHFLQICKGPFLHDAALVPLQNVTVILLVLRRSLVIPLVDVERSSKVVSVSAKRGSLVASVIYVNLATGISTGITFLDVKVTSFITSTVNRFIMACKFWIKDL